MYFSKLYSLAFEVVNFIFFFAPNLHNNLIGFLNCKLTSFSCTNLRASFLSGKPHPYSISLFVEFFLTISAMLLSSLYSFIYITGLYSILSIFICNISLKHLSHVFLYLNSLDPLRIILNLLKANSSSIKYGFSLYT